LFLRCFAVACDACNIIVWLVMVRDGIYYGLGMAVVAGVVGWLAGPAWAVPPLVLGGFFLWFFRDPERSIPAIAGAIVSPADGKVTEISTVQLADGPRTRISIFLNVFDVHVNRSPIAGVIRKVEYRRGKFGNAMGAISAEENEQNIVTVEGEGHTLIFKQIAGLLARRIVFTKAVGDAVGRGERVGLIKFGSRTDIIMSPEAELRIKVGDRVRGGSSVLAIYAPVYEAAGGMSAPSRVQGGGD
jgi:phosphatidylserine decarboxylase